MCAIFKSALIGSASVLLLGCQASRPAVVACDKCTTPDVRNAYSVPSYEGPRKVGYLTTEGRSCQCGLAAGPAAGSPCPHCNGVVTGQDDR